MEEWQGVVADDGEVSYCLLLCFCLLARIISGMWDGMWDVGRVLYSFVQYDRLG